MTVTLDQDPTLAVAQQPRPIELLDPAAMEVRVGSALETCDFIETPELREAMTGYFTEQYSTAAAVDSILTSDPSQMMPEEKTAHMTQLDGLIGQHELPENFDAQFTELLDQGQFTDNKLMIKPLLVGVRAARLDNPDDAALQRAELQLVASLTYNLFSEASVGVTTVSEEDKEMVVSLQARVKSTVDESNLFETDNSYRPKDLTLDEYGHTKNRFNRIVEDFRDPRANIEEANELFWGNVRHAGQLLFHSTRSHGAVRGSGAILPRRMQQQRNGSMNAFNEDFMNGKIWSPMVHWNERLAPLKDFKDTATIGYGSGREDW